MLSCCLAGLAAASPSSSTAVSLDCKRRTARATTATGTLHGTVLCPGGSPPWPVVLIIAGSGPTDRDGNSAGLPGHNDSLRLLAEGLLARGIASIRYDKRGLAESKAAIKGEADLRFDTLVDDATFWLRGLRSGHRFGASAALGHSEGSLIGMLAVRQAGADAFVSIAGTARPASELMHDQFAERAPGLLTDANRILGELSAGRTVGDVPQSLAPLFRPGVQPYLISWIRYDPQKELAKLTVPILVVQGTTDIQVPVTDARLLASANPSATLKLVPGMNHVLKEVSGDLRTQLSSYSDPGLPLAPTLVETIATFLQKQRAQPAPRPSH